MDTLLSMDFLKQNAMTIIISLAGIAGTFTIYGYRIDTLEKTVEENRTAIVTLNQQQNNIHVQLGQISTDLQYIKANIDRLFGRSTYGQ